MPIDYSKFDRLVAANEEEDLRIEEARRKVEEDLDRRRREERKLKDIEKLRLAEEEWRCRSDAIPSVKHEGQQKLLTKDDSTTVDDTVAAAGGNCSPGCEDPLLATTKQVVQANAAGKDFDSMTEEDLARMDVDDFFRPLSAEEKERKKRAREEAKERHIQKEEALGKRPLRDKEMSSEQVALRIEHLENDRIEMIALMERSDRPAVKARLGEFVVEMGNELARLREDPLELDDEDRHELRLFQLRRYQLPGVARTRKECSVDETTYAPKVIDAATSNVRWEQPWHELSTYALEIGDTLTPFVNVDVRVEAVERLQKSSVKCEFTEKSFDLQIQHDLNGVRYRLRKTCLQYDILPEQSEFLIKRNHVIITLAKAPDTRDVSSDPRHPRFPPWSDLSASNNDSRNCTFERPD